MPNGSLHKLPTDVWAVSKSSRCCGESLVWSPADDAQVSGTAELWDKRLKQTFKLMHNLPSPLVNEVEYMAGYTLVCCEVSLRVIWPEQLGETMLDDTLQESPMILLVTQAFYHQKII